MDYQNLLEKEMELEDKLYFLNRDLKNVQLKRRTLQDELLKQMLLAR